MSQYLNFSLKHKENKEENIVVDLFTLYTTPAREISSLGAFPFTEEEVVLDRDTMNDYIYILKEEIEERQKHITECENKLNELKDNLNKVQNVEIYKHIQEEIDSVKYSLIGLQEYFNEWEYNFNSIVMVREIANTNKDDWDLIYTNC